MNVNKRTYEAVVVIRVGLEGGRFAGHGETTRWRIDHVP